MLLLGHPKSTYRTTTSFVFVFVPAPQSGTRMLNCMHACRVSGGAEDPADPAVRAWAVVALARFAVIGSVVHAARLLALAESLDPDIPVLPPSLPPRVPYDPVQHAILFAVANKLHGLRRKRTYRSPPVHICTGTGPALVPLCTSARSGLTPSHVCTGAGLTRCHICTGTGLTPATSASRRIIA